MDIDRIAALCRIALTHEERKTISRQLDAMLAYMQQLKEIDIRHVPATLHASDLYATLRDDQPGKSFSVETALSNAPKQENHQIVVPRIVE